MGCYFRNDGLILKMKKTLLIILIILSIRGFSQSNESLKKVNWNGYIQLRALSNFDDYSSAMVRRLKFWLKSSPEFSKHWSYKIQVLFTSKMQERLFLQDAKMSYKTGLFSFDFGQFVPAYSLQWTQPDWKIPSLERAIVVNALHPDGTMGVRDIGIQTNFHTKNKLIETHFGIFNGYGIKQYRFDNQGYMVSHKTTVNIPMPKNKLQIGYSLMYRYAHKMHFKKVLPDTLLYSGIDLRYNIFAMFKSKLLEMQAEYLNAGFDQGLNANGYYVLSAINVKKNQIVMAFEDYKNTYMDHHPYYRLGYNYLINNNKIKVFFDNYFQLIEGKIENYYASLQLQMFFK